MSVMLDSNFDMDVPLEAILQRPLTCFEKQQIQEQSAKSAESCAISSDEDMVPPPLRRRLKDMAKLQVIRMEAIPHGCPQQSQSLFDAELA
ncbi:hypothetical protein [Chromobacterium sp. IIBBL 290-4]|uniref:hypothetical protein n=1 Tax=Chromobacterium sp. IIBBL 290-4 TaxID=2953890 RepID=UPI0020B7811F|nr:hypothetical protein [Chromobacterium sp. IIBBL 290-4]UTH73679.1 hypothetical protein NKT35_19365 [Chromobacterium sp. IIBBL 290-4]